uniref:Uncharacterized protein n=1 Tax=Acrobeloides nanus TaxID=290746 RepID=A0A914CNL4_9BILA
MGVKDHEEFLKNPILKEEFDNLWPADQSKLLNQFFNAYRKEHGKISDLQAIAYARRPIVSFIYDKQLKFEVSIRNLLGEIKANFVGNVVQQEPTGTLKKFIFGLRVWAELHNIFQDERYPRGVFKSYTLSLFVVSFLQQAGYIGPVKMTGTRILNKWNTAYEVSFFKELSADDLPKLYRNFFVFVTNTINEDKVHSVRDARIYTTNDFYEVHCKADKRIEENFKFSLVNIQDPIELSHNVGSNIIKHYVALLRRKAILSLSKLKKNSFDFSELLLITESHEASMRSNERPQHAISIEFDYSPDNERLIKSINFLMEKILRFTVVQTPSAKRARTTMEDSSFKMRYMATFRTWIGRRPLRRQFMRQYPQSREVELEQMVSEELQRAAEFTENLVDFHLTIQPRAKNLDIFVDLFGGTDQDGNDLVHFLDTFLHKYFPEAMLGYKWSAQRNLNEEMNEFMEVD